MINDQDRPVWDEMQRDAAPNDLEQARYEVTYLNCRIEQALEIAFFYGQIDGDHHKRWVVDQMVRKLTGARYDDWVKDYQDGEDGPETYEWDTGIAP